MTWTNKTQEIQVGATVAYRRQFLKSIGCYAGDMPRARGQVTALLPLGKDTVLAEVTWDHLDLPGRVNVKNLCLAKNISLEL